MSAPNPVHVPLHIAQAVTSELSSIFQSATGHAGSSDHEIELNQTVGVLRKLWDCVVSPVVQALRTLSPVAHASSGVQLLSSRSFPCMQQELTTHTTMISPTFIFPLTPQLWRHSFVRDSRFLATPPVSISLPLVKRTRMEGRNFGVLPLS
ncbi:hypothetical protein DFH29DRAFT_898512 [Suillus ampliporus]|nr:hypothetical protein DFH29DRAFT_898512 [Suillus ampliporus]